MANEAKKGRQKLGKLLKKGQQNFEVTKKGQQNISLRRIQYIWRYFLCAAPRKLGAAMRRVQRISVGRRPAQWMEIFPTGS